MLTALGSWSYRRRRWVMAAWAVIFVIGIAIGSQVFNQLKDSPGGSGSESIKGFNLIDRANPHGPEVIALINGRPVNDLATKAAVLAAKAKLAKLPAVTDVTTAYDVNDPRLRSSDGHASLMLITVKKTNMNDQMAMHQQVGDIRAALAHSVPGASVKVGGDLAFSRDEMAADQNDLLQGELIALPILLLALLFVFRGCALALLPLAGALVTVAGALLLLLGVTHFIDVASYAVDVVILFGLALAVDYSLLMVNRFREERAAGADVARRGRAHRCRRRAHHHLLRADRHRRTGRAVRLRRSHVHLARRRRHRHRRSSRWPPGSPSSRRCWPRGGNKIRP